MPEKLSYQKLEEKYRALEIEVGAYKDLYGPLPSMDKCLRDGTSLTHPYLVLDAEGRIFEANQLWLDLFLYRNTEVVGTFFADLLCPGDRELFHTEVMDPTCSRSKTSVEIRLQKKNGPLLTMLLDCRREGDVATGMILFHCIFREGDGLQGREKAAPAAADDSWRLSFDSIHDIVTIQDKNFKIIRANKAAHDFFQVDKGLLTGKYCYEIFSGMSRPCPNCPLLSTHLDKNEHSAVISHELLNKVFKVDSAVIPATDGMEETLLHVARDITEERLKEQRLYESNERFVKAFDFSPAPMVIAEIDSGIFINVNQRWLEMLGYSRDELLGKTSTEVGIWKDPEVRVHAVARFRAESSLSNYPVEFITKTGGVRSALWSAEKISLQGREFMLSLITDVTEQKRAEKKLQESEEKFSLAFNSSPDAININRFEDGLYIDINEGFTSLTGFTRADVSGKTSLDLDIWGDTADRGRLLTILKENGYCENLEARFRRKDGTVCLGLMSARLISLSGKAHIISVTRDISKIRKIEREILEQKLLFETMFNAIEDGVFLTDTKGQILLANKSTESLFGYCQEEFIGNTTEFLYPDGDQYQKLYWTKGGTSAPISDRVTVAKYRNKSGKQFPGEVFGTKLFDKNNKWIGHLVIIHDISARHEREVERERLVAAIEQTRDAIVITDRAGIVQYVNPSFESVTGYSREEVLQQNLSFLKSGEQAPSFYQKMWQTLNSGETFKGRLVNRHKDGSFFTEEVTISPIFDGDGQIINFVAVKSDITEQILLESQLQHAQKMEAVGRLTGGVAHDFNNILGVIIGYTELALQDVEPQQKVHGDLKKILAAAKRSADIVRQLLAFSRKQTVSPKLLNLNKAVKGIYDILQSLIGEQIELAWIVGSDPLMIKIDPTQIDQILANLCVNAKDAIGSGSAGKIIIETKQVVLDEQYCASHIGLYPGDFVQLSISDNGCGIEKEHLSRIFEPFYSTKNAGHGTGLGLSTVYGIVTQNNGFINVYSEPGRGTTFTVNIPLRQEAERTPAKKTSSKNRCSQGETVLLVEDDPVLLSMAQQMLERLGYIVLAAARPNEAIGLAKKCDGKIDMILTDVVMPEMTGKELISAITLLFPDVKVLFMSGYTANVIAHNGILDEGIRFIQKPYTIDDLATKVRTTLTGS
ncbi:PAS domain S-box protein [Desulforhopalus sp. IMCC35007]|uniref:PAS domain S-box protein n=1 Tax=Desulforhopalus sp. IMCC35007 TaxID=2569543 RepID=UPI0010AE1CFB|nr:PAS domain S-box protein [Desulforhopalus sp. IMCC35007]TKB08009.1 PAS domain S-box protein [Desulforhopalus sp. IMCC35007]